MGNLFRDVTKFVRLGGLLFSALMFANLSACSKGDSKATTPSDIQVSNVVSDLMKKFNACDNQEFVRAIDESAHKTIIHLEDQVEVANLQFVRCDGSVSKETHGPVRRVEYLLPFSALAAKENIRFVVVSNERTCAQQSFGLSKKSKLVSEPTKMTAALEIEEKDRPSLSSAYLASGGGQIRLSDSPLKLKELLNIKPGPNVIQITFYGACEEFKPTASSGTVSANDFDQCLRAPKIGQQEILVYLNVSDIEASGTYRFDICESK